MRDAALSLCDGLKDLPKSQKAMKDAILEVSRLLVEGGKP